MDSNGPLATPEALDLIETALKAGASRSIKAEAPIYEAAFRGLEALRREKRIGARRVIRALREGRGGPPKGP